MARRRPTAREHHARAPSQALTPMLTPPALSRSVYNLPHSQAWRRHVSSGRRGAAGDEPRRRGSGHGGETRAARNARKRAGLDLRSSRGGFGGGGHDDDDELDPELVKLLEEHAADADGEDGTRAAQRRRRRGPDVADPTAGAEPGQDWQHYMSDKVAPFVPTPAIAVRSFMDICLPQYHTAAAAAEAKAVAEGGGVWRPPVFVDVGCGDGRVVMAAADRLQRAQIEGARAVGVDIDPDLVLQGIETAVRERLTTADFVCANVFDAPAGPAGDESDEPLIEVLRDATVVYVFFGQEGVAKLAPVLVRHLRPGTLVASLEYPFAIGSSDDVAAVTPGGDAPHLVPWELVESQPLLDLTLYVYRVP